jgi:hypothetical protein
LTLAGEAGVEGAEGHRATAGHRARPLRAEAAGRHRQVHERARERRARSSADGRVSQDALAGHNSVKDAEVYQQNTISSFVILPCVLKTNMKLMVLNMV